jgi:hypothetical protein
MAKTLDQFPGERFEESILFDPGVLPTLPGETIYVSASILGSGHFFMDATGTLKSPVPPPKTTGQILMATTDTLFVPATPIVSLTFGGGWLLNDSGMLLVSASL